MINLYKVEDSSHNFKLTLYILYRQFVYMYISMTDQAEFL